VSRPHSCPNLITAEPAVKRRRTAKGMISPARMSRAAWERGATSILLTIQPISRLRLTMADPSYEEGDRVAVLRMHGLTGDIQIIPATVVGVIDEYQVVVRFAGGEEISYPIADLTPMPKSDAG